MANDAVGIACLVDAIIRTGPQVDDFVKSSGSHNDWLERDAVFAGGAYCMLVRCACLNNDFDYDNPDFRKSLAKYLWARNFPDGAIKSSMVSEATFYLIRAVFNK